MSSDAGILDIGCSTGGFLSVLRDMGFHDLRGLDPSPRCADAAARRLYDVEVLTGTLNRLPDLRPPFDLICLLGVIKHIRDLLVSSCVCQKEIERQIRDVLKLENRLHLLYDLQVADPTTVTSDSQRGAAHETDQHHHALLQRRRERREHVP